MTQAVAQALAAQQAPSTLPHAAVTLMERLRALLSWQRCKPERPPVDHEGDLYHLDRNDDELDLAVFRLDLWPAKIVGPDPSQCTDLGLASKILWSVGDEPGPQRL